MSDNKTITIKIEIFGAFRNFFDDKFIEFNLNAPCTLSDIRVALSKAMLEAKPDSEINKLVNSSAFALDSDILNDESKTFDRDTQLAIIPPVCGG